MIQLTKLDNVMYEAQRQGRISFYLTSHGESAAQLGSSFGLNPDDLVFGNILVLIRFFIVYNTISELF